MNKWYDGYMKIPLDQSLSNEQVQRRSEFHGDFLNAKIRHEVLTLPHIYKVTAHVAAHGDKAVTTISAKSVSERKSVAEISAMAFDDARAGECKIDMDLSYIILRAKRLTKREKIALRAEQRVVKKQSPVNVLNYNKFLRGVK